MIVLKVIMVAVTVNKQESKTSMGCPYTTSRPAEVVKSPPPTLARTVVPVEGRITCKTTGGFLYFLWSSKAPDEQYLGSIGQTPGARLLQHRRYILEGVNKAVPEHFRQTKSTVDHLVFRPVKKLVCLHFEHEFISQYNLIQSGIDRILT